MGGIPDAAIKSLNCARKIAVRTKGFAMAGMQSDEERQRMSNVDTRQVDRDSLFLLAQLRVDGRDEHYRVKVRNLSAGGMMAEGDVRVLRGALVEVELRNLGWIEGTVAWKQDNRFGIAFVDEIDPKRARAQVTGSTVVHDGQGNATRSADGKRVLKL